MESGPGAVGPEVTAPQRGSVHDREAVGELTRRALIVGSCFLIAMIADSIIEPSVSIVHAWRVLNGQLDQDLAHAFLAAIARLLGFLLASSITLCGIAIPLTANNYTPKLIMLFVKDRVNWCMFGLLVGSTMLVHWTLLTSAGEDLPRLNVALSGLLGFLSLGAMIPYIFYLFRVLLPEMIITRIEREVFDDLERLQRSESAEEVLAIRRRLFEDLKYISNIVLRSIDRHDRDTALFGIETLRHIFDRYVASKAELPKVWFEVDASDFLSKPGDVLQQIETSRTVFEVELLEECALVLSVAIGRFREGVRMLGITVRHVATVSVMRQDEGAADMARVYFNSFVRAAISARNPDAIYMLIFQYRQLAEDLLLVSPREAARVAFYLDYYGHQAVRSGIVFVANLIAYDLASLAILAYELDAECRDALFNQFLEFDRNDTLRNFPGVVKSHVKVLTLMHQMGREAEVERLMEEVALIDSGLIEAAIKEIESVDTPFYWEITDRRRHLDYVEPEQRESFEAIKARLLKAEAVKKA